MTNGVTGYIVDNDEQAVAAVNSLHNISRAACRRGFEERFTVERMARDYLAVYRRLAHRQSRRANGVSIADDAKFPRAAVLPPMLPPDSKFDLDA